MFISCRAESRTFLLSLVIPSSIIHPFIGCVFSGCSTVCAVLEVGRLISLMATTGVPAAARAALGRGRGPKPFSAAFVIRISVARCTVAISMPVRPSTPYVTQRNASDAVAAAPKLPPDRLAVVLGMATAARSTQVIFAAIEPMTANASQVEARSSDKPQTWPATASTRLPSPKPSATPSAVVVAAAKVASLMARFADPSALSP